MEVDNQNQIYHHQNKIYVLWNQNKTSQLLNYNLSIEKTKILKDVLFL